MILIQIGVEHLSSMTSDSVTNEANNSSWSGSSIWILVIVLMNLLLIIVKFFLDRSNGKKENEHYRTRKVMELSIEKEAELFEKLEKMSLFAKGEEHALLGNISDVECLMSKNRIFYSKKLYHHSITILDYYKRINSDLTKKDLKKEEKLFDEYHKLYYGQ